MNSNSTLNIFIMTKHLEPYQVGKRKSDMNLDVHVISLSGKKKQKVMFFYYYIKGILKNIYYIKRNAQ